MPTLAAPPVLPPPVEVTEAERNALLDIARSAIAAALGRGVEGPLEGLVPPPSLRDRLGGAFVTLMEDGDLRGCIGVLQANRRLVESVAIAAVGAALRDDRFMPVEAAELRDIEVEVSVLGPFIRLSDPEAFRAGVDGLFVQRGWTSGLMLPEVATTHALDTIGMLQATCRKAGLAPDAWRDPGTLVSAFRTCRFGGAAIG